MRSIMIACLTVTMIALGAAALLDDFAQVSSSATFTNHSITADTDISAFLQSGMPAKSAGAALRRTWVSDPVIRDFIGIAENQWDFTDPMAISGFGPVQRIDDKLSLVAQAAGKLDLPVDELSGPLPNAAAGAEQEASATGASDRDEVAATARATQVASTMVRGR